MGREDDTSQKGLVNHDLDKFQRRKLRGKSRDAFFNLVFELAFLLESIVLMRSFLFSSKCASIKVALLGRKAAPLRPAELRAPKERAQMKVKYLICPFFISIWLCVYCVLIGKVPNASDLCGTEEGLCGTGFSSERMREREEVLKRVTQDEAEGKTNLRS